MGQAKVHTMGGFYGAKHFKPFDPVYFKRVPVYFKNRTEQDAGINLEWGDRSLQDRWALESVGGSAEGVCAASELGVYPKRGTGDSDSSRIFTKEWQNTINCTFYITRYVAFIFLYTSLLGKQLASIYRYAVISKFSC